MSGRVLCGGLPVPGLVFQLLFVWIIVLTALKWGDYMYSIEPTDGTAYTAYLDTLVSYI